MKTIFCILLSLSHATPSAITGMPSRNVVTQAASGLNRHFDYAQAAARLKEHFTSPEDQRLIDADLRAALTENLKPNFIVGQRAEVDVLVRDRKAFRLTVGNELRVNGTPVQTKGSYANYRKSFQAASRDQIVRHGSSYFLPEANAGAYLVFIGGVIATVYFFFRAVELYTREQIDIQTDKLARATEACQKGEKNQLVELLSKSEKAAVATDSSRRESLTEECAVQVAADIKKHDRQHARDELLLYCQAFKSALRCAYPDLSATLGSPTTPSGSAAQ